MEDEANNGARKQQIQAAYEIWQKSIAGGHCTEKHSNVSANRLRTESRLRKETRLRLSTMQPKLPRKRASAIRHGCRRSLREDKEAVRAQVSRANGAIAEVNSHVKNRLTAVTDGRVTEAIPRDRRTGYRCTDRERGCHQRCLVYLQHSWRQTFEHPYRRADARVRSAMNKSYPVRILLMKNVGNLPHGKPPRHWDNTTSRCWSTGNGR